MGFDSAEVVLLDLAGARREVCECVSWTLGSGSLAYKPKKKVCVVCECFFRLDSHSAEPNPVIFCGE